MTHMNVRSGLQPSLLDRLTAEHPAASPLAGAAHTLSDCREALRRDLENLLNTRRWHAHDLEAWPELQRSLLSYGLPDFSTVLLGSAEHRERFRHAVQQLIERCESRLQAVRVSIAKVGEEHERTLYLKISALLMVEPEPLPLVFDSRIRSLDRVVTLREQDHG